MMKRKLFYAESKPSVHIPVIPHNWKTSYTAGMDVTYFKLTNVAKALQMTTNQK